ncbi:MAG TPA: solute carrier family 23 protein, partial [Kutzneria sp.]|nr:solute carrier family 23 protein [Kutzneria sp.]
GFGKPINLAVAFGVLVLVVLVHRFVPGLIGRIAVLVGIVLGTVAAIPLGLADFSGIGGAPVIEVTTPFHFGLPTFEPGAIIAFVIVMLVTMTETSGSVLAVGDIVDRPVDSRTLTRALRADGLSSLLGGVFNTFPYTAFGQNVGLVALTRVRSRYVVATAGGILVLLGLFPLLGQIVASVPSPVLGGAGLVMFGSVAAGGVRMLRQVDFDGNANLMIVAVALGIGLVPVAAPTVYAQFPGWFQTIMNSGISAGSIAAVLLNLLFNGVKSSTQPSEMK